MQSQGYSPDSISPDSEYSKRRPHPLFFIIRPGGILAPLIPIDELPSWLQVCNWSSNTPVDMRAVSPECIPRKGELDVICHHCSCSVDSLHQSVSERNTDSPVSPASRSKSCPTGYCNPPEVCNTSTEDFAGVYRLHTRRLGTNTVSAAAAFQKPPSSPSGSPSMSDPSPEESPHSVQGSSNINSSIQASLIHAVARCNQVSATASAVLREVQNTPIACTPHVEVSPVMDEEREKISAAIATSLCGKSVNESLASTRSITAAVQRYQEVRKVCKPRAKLARHPSIPHSVISKTSIKTGRSRSSSVHTAHTAASSRRVKVRRRRRRRRADKGKVSKPSSAVVLAEPKPEQVNSATKRRDRREKLARGHKDKGPNHQYVHMMANLLMKKTRQ